MPWIPELFSEPVLEEWRERHARQKIVDVPFFDGILADEPDALVGAFAGEPTIFDPVRGRIQGAWQLRAYAAEATRWMRENGGVTKDLLIVTTPARGFEEVVLRSPRVELPIALVADHADDSHLREIRLYYSAHQFLGHRTTRQPLLQPDPALDLPPVLAEYFRALADADLDAASAAFAKGGTLRTADGLVHSDLHGLHAAVCRAGGLVMDPCSLCGDGRHVAMEYNVLRLSDQRTPPQAGVAIFDLEPGGARITAARIYDDIELPALSQP